MDRPRSLTILAVALAALAAAACADDGSGDAGADAAPPPACVPADGFPTYAEYDLIQLDVLPTEVNATTGWLRPDVAHGVYVGKDRPTRPELLVVLGEPAARPDEQRWIARVAAFAGYRVLVLAYADADVATLCAGGAAASCAEDVRSEVLYGRDLNDGLRVDPENGAVARLEGLLAHVAAKSPQLGFGDFVPAAGAALDWSRVVLVGAGDGGGHVGVLARDHAVARTVYLGVAADAAPWATTLRATAAAAERALGHEDDGGFAALEAALAAWGLDAFGAMTRVDGAAPPYACTHQLSTARSAAAPCSARASLATDACLGLDAAGVPLLAPAWLYLLLAD